MVFSSKHIIPWIFWTFVILYAALFLISPALGPNDDVVFVRTLQAGKPLLYYSPSFPYYESRALGRFTPIVSMEYNLMALIAPTAFWYYFFHVVQFILFALLAIHLFRRALNQKYWSYLIFFVLTLLPAFTIIWFRLQLPERNVIFWATVFLVLYLRFAEKPHFITAFGAILAANLAIYDKEVAFILFGTFGAVHFLLILRNGEKKMRALDLAMVGSAVLYLAIYYFYVFLHSNPFLKTVVSHAPLSLLKNALNYGFFSDPLILLLATPLFFWRLYAIFIRKESPEPVYDSMLGSAAAYILTYIATGLYGPYYLLPAYIFAIPPILFFFRQGTFRNVLGKSVLVVVGFLVVVNDIPAGIHYLTYHKYISKNFDDTTTFLSTDIKQRRDTQHSIFLDGIDLADGRGTFFIFAEFMRLKGLTPHDFDLKANTPTAHPVAILSKIQEPFTAFTSDTPSPISSGDYLVITPQRAVPTSEEYLASLNKDYKLVFRTQSPLAVPQFTLKTLAKYALSHFSFGKKLMKNENLLDEPDYLVFVKR